MWKFHWNIFFHRHWLYGCCILLAWLSTSPAPVTGASNNHKGFLVRDFFDAGFTTGCRKSARRTTLKLKWDNGTLCWLFWIYWVNTKTRTARLQVCYLGQGPSWSEHPVPPTCMNLCCQPGSKLVSHRIVFPFRRWWLPIYGFVSHTCWLQISLIHWTALAICWQVSSPIPRLLHWPTSRLCWHCISWWLALQPSHQFSMFMSLLLFLAQHSWASVFVHDFNPRFISDA